MPVKIELKDEVEVILEDKSVEKFSVEFMLQMINVYRKSVNASQVDLKQAIVILTKEDEG